MLVNTKVISEYLKKSLGTIVTCIIIKKVQVKEFYKVNCLISGKNYKNNKTSDAAVLPQLSVLPQLPIYSCTVLYPCYIMIHNLLLYPCYCYILYNDL